MIVRDIRSSDIPALQRVADETGLFPADMLPDMASEFLSGDDPSDLWIALEADGEVVGFCYAAPEEMADGTWNMLALAVLPSRQKGGVGAALVAELENRLRAQGNRILVVDTSGTPNFEGARAFYRRSGYVEEARIRDFWAKGDDKVIFWKSLTS
jgi:ribosomal protein S18 acetylase RimI-like enzyme